MSGRWWRAYDEALDDPKLQRLPAALFKHWFNLMCVASAQNGTLMEPENVAYKLRVSLLKAQLIISALMAVGLLDRRSDGTIEPHNWQKRQYKSDVVDPTAAERMRRFRRNANRNANRNATVTLIRPDTETDTEKKKKKETKAYALVKKEEEAAREQSKKNEKGSRLAPDWQPSAKDAEDAGKIGLRLYEIDAEIPKFIDYWRAKAGPNAVKRDWSATWRNWCRRAFEQQQKPQGVGNGRQLQDDRLSVGKALERLATADVRPPPRPSLVRPASKTDHRLLPKG
jgi:hypothetical protein